MKSTFCFNASLKDSIASCKKYIENYFTRITATLSFPYLTEGLIRGLAVIFFFFLHRRTFEKRGRKCNKLTRGT